MMNKTVMAAAIVLIAGTPLAFARTSEKINPAEFSTRHCSVVEDQVSHMKFKSEAARQATEQEAASVCRHDGDRSKAHAM